MQAKTAAAAQPQPAKPAPATKTQNKESQKAKMRAVETESSDEDYGDEVAVPKTRAQKELAKKGVTADPTSPPMPTTQAQAPKKEVEKPKQAPATVDLLNMGGPSGS